MARSIMVDPARLEEASNKMDQQTAEYERLYKALFNEVEAMQAAWQGQDNVAYVTQIKGFMDDFQQMSQLMRQYSDFLKMSAKTYRNTQGEVVNAARRLTN
ncbi:WXG100 family type VII secretion target [Mesobacillus maritimus]|uniref:WXG100 family type VII secretion target n=1 Tax=Mesobacillus maritimus TaxID=1643336 RepID=UPI00203B091B|nr:WXG100 family type VII secretion target [Mesobacillus maritimus]MCM3585268.1 WXG100 family type VII secretion target [Mesobacillus maritimus]MCM3668155.1 WXG100 family type VII secretion target [Mesobacillus maritimus]